MVEQPDPPWSSSEGATEPLLLIGFGFCALITGALTVSFGRKWRSLSAADSPLAIAAVHDWGLWFPDSSPLPFAELATVRHHTIAAHVRPILSAGDHVGNAAIRGIERRRPEFSTAHHDLRFVRRDGREVAMRIGPVCRPQDVAAFLAALEWAGRRAGVEVTLDRSQVPTGPR